MADPKRCPACRSTKIQRFSAVNKLVADDPSAHLGCLITYRCDKDHLLQGQLATKQSTAATEVRLLDGHKGTKMTATIAVELGSAESAMLRAARASFPHYGPATSGPELLGNLRL